MSRNSTVFTLLVKTALVCAVSIPLEIRADVPTSLQPVQDTPQLLDWQDPVPLSEDTLESNAQLEADDSSSDLLQWQDPIPVLEDDGGGGAPDALEDAPAERTD